MRLRVLGLAGSFILCGAGLAAWRNHRPPPGSQLVPSRPVTTPATVPVPAPPLPPSTWPPNPVTYDCSGFAPRRVVQPAEKVPYADAVRTLYRVSRWYGVTAVPCAVGPSLDSRGLSQALRAIAILRASDVSSMPLLERVAAQNASMRLARCTRSADLTGKNGPTGSQIAALKAASYGLLTRLRVTNGELASLDGGRRAVELWLGSTPEEPPQDLATSALGVHERANALTLATRAIGTAKGVDAFYGAWVVIDDAGSARVSGVPGELYLRRTSANGLTVCFAELDLDHLRSGPILSAVSLPVGPLEISGVRCDRCHLRGRRLSEGGAGSVAEAPPDARLLADVTNWYASAGGHL